MDDLLAALRAEGLAIGIPETLRVHSLLEAAARSAEDPPGARAWDLDHLRDLLACAIVRTQDEREKFNRIFKAWRGDATQHLERLAPDLHPTPPRPAPDSPSPPRPGERATRPRLWPARLPFRFRSRSRWQWAILAAAVLAVAAAGIWLTTRPPAPAPTAAPAPAPKPPPEPTTSPDPAKDPDPLPKTPSRPATFVTRSLTIQIQKPPQSAALPFLAVLAILSAVAASALFWFLRRNQWLPLPRAESMRPGPPLLPFLRADRRAPALLPAAARDDIAFAVDRFLRDEPSPDLDIHRSIDATIAEGGRACLVFRPRIEHRTVWLWVDRASESPLVSRFADEIGTALTAGGLPSERAWYWTLPDRLDADDGSSLAPHDLEDAAHGSAILLLTDGHALARRLAVPEAFEFAKPLFRVLARFPRAALVVIDAERRRALESLTRTLGLEILAPEDIDGFLAGQDRARAAPAPRRRLEGDALAWAASCALSERPVDLPTALELRESLALKDSPTWLFDRLLAEAGTPDGRVVVPRDRRAFWLTWLGGTAVRGTPSTPINDESLAAEAISFWRRRLEHEDAERTAQEAQMPWRDTPAERRLKHELALLALWDRPDEAAFALHGLHGRLAPSDRARVLNAYAAPLSRGARGLSPPDRIVLPWAISDRDEQARVLLEGLGLRVLTERKVRHALDAPGRVVMAIGLALGLTAGAGVGALGMWLRRPKAAPICSTSEGIWCSVAQVSPGLYRVIAGAGRSRAFSEAPAEPGDEVRVSFGQEASAHCEEAPLPGVRLLRCGLREEPVPREPGWTARRSVGIVMAGTESAEGRAWADALLDSGSVDEVVMGPIADTDDVLATLGEDALNAEDQILMVAEAADTARAVKIEKWAAQRGTAGPSLAIQSLGAADEGRDVFKGSDVRAVAEVWPSARVLGAPKLAGVVSLQDGAAPDGGSGNEILIRNSGECLRAEEEYNGMIFVRVCGGIFKMGSDDAEAYEDEKPVHEVQISTFWIGKYEVSNRELRTRVKEHGPGELESWPATNVDWKTAWEFCESRGHRLPTEAEWEYAARGPEGRKYPWGDQEPTEKLAAFGTAKLVDVTKFSDVGSPFGTVNQAGNVWEWVQDWYDEKIYETRAGQRKINPLSDNSRSLGRVVRGGSFFHVPRYLRSSVRDGNWPEVRFRDLGFRCARGGARQH